MFGFPGDFSCIIGACLQLDANVPFFGACSPLLVLLVMSTHRMGYILTSSSSFNCAEGPIGVVYMYLAHST